MANLKDHSRLNFDSDGTFQSIQAGCMQRIADAVEKVALSYTRLQEDAERYKKYWREEQAVTERMMKSNAALRGHIKRLKKKV